jgi:hypothetical protein
MYPACPVEFLPSGTNPKDFLHSRVSLGLPFKLGGQLPLREFLLNHNALDPMCEDFFQLTVLVAIFLEAKIRI